jgi:hypothetical protein
MAVPARVAPYIAERSCDKILGSCSGYRRSAAHARLADSAMPLRGTTGRLRQQQRMARLGSKQRTIADGPPDDALAP